MVYKINDLTLGSLSRVSVELSGEKNLTLNLVYFGSTTPVGVR